MLNQGNEFCSSNNAMHKFKKSAHLQVKQGIEKRLIIIPG